MTYRANALHVPGTGRLLSPHGPRRGRVHNGIDLARGDGNAYAIGDGVVTHATANGVRGFGCYGRVVVVRHPQWNVWSLHAHLSDVFVNTGDEVIAGEALGTIGDTNGSASQPGTRMADWRCTRDGHAPQSHSEERAHDHFEIATAHYPLADSAPRLDPIAFMEEHGIVYGDDGRPDVISIGLEEQPGPPRRSERVVRGASPIVILAAVGVAATAVALAVSR